MIDEELYQQAADELNSDKRRPALWARACALASDDHDEARFLYTNLRVEELLAEKAQTLDMHDSTYDDLDKSLALEPMDETVADEDEPVGFLDGFELDDAEEGNAQPASTKPGVDSFTDEDDYITLEPLSDLSDKPDEADNLTLDSSEIPDSGLSEYSPLDLSQSIVDPDESMMADYLPEHEGILDDTYAGTETISADDISSALEAVSDEQSQISDPNVPQIETADFVEEPQPLDLTQANVQVLDEHTDELDAILGSAQHDLPKPSQDDSMAWLDDDVLDHEPAEPSHEAEPIEHQENSYTDELERQADELGLNDRSGADTDMTGNFSDELSGDVTEFDDLPSIEHEIGEVDSVDVAAFNAEINAEYDAEQANANASAHVSTQSDTNGFAQAAVSGAAGAAIASAPDMSSPHSGLPSGLHPGSSFPLDLTEGRSGREYWIFQRDTKARAVKNGVSWSAMLLTLPYLLYRQLFGTALAYSLLWIISIGGLVISALAWIDAGAAVTPLTQACAIGFALIAFIGLFYLPFRYGNSWRADKLENRGYELVAISKAKNPGKAIARARNSSALIS